MPPIIAVYDAFKFAAMEMRERVAIRSGCIAMSSRNRQQRSRLQSQKDEYDIGRAPQTTPEHSESTGGGAAVLPRKKAPLAIGEQERLKAFYEKIRTDGLPTNNSVQVPNDQTKYW